MGFRAGYLLNNDGIEQNPTKSVHYTFHRQAHRDSALGAAAAPNTHLVNTIGYEPTVISSNQVNALALDESDRRCRRIGPRHPRSVSPASVLALACSSALQDPPYPHTPLQTTAADAWRAVPRSGAPADVSAPLSLLRHLWWVPALHATPNSPCTFPRKHGGMRIVRRGL